MADKPLDKVTLPALIPQNPAPALVRGQDFITAKREQVDRIMEVFIQVLPSNYVSQVTGPFYTIQFQAVAEAIAEFQITAQEAFADSDYDYMRAEFLFQLLGQLVFPDAVSDGYPTLQGDLTYRDFLKKMVGLLLQGATKDTQQAGLELLSDADFEVIEKVIEARHAKMRVWDKATGRWTVVPGSAWGLDDQFEFEINVSYIDPDTETQRFPVDPFILSENARIVLRALKPAHTLYDYRHLFRESFGALFDDSMSWDWSSYYYADFRRFCCGAKQVTGVSGITWSDRGIFSDTTREFDQITAGADLVVTSGPNSIHVGGTEQTSSSTDLRHIGRYRVKDVLAFPVGTDVTARAYTTSPTGLVSKAVVTDDVITDSYTLGRALNGLLKVPVEDPVRFATGQFFISIDDVLYTPVGVVALSDDPVGVEYLTAATATDPKGRMKFGTSVLALHPDGFAVYVGDWAQAVEGETLTFTEGPNAGTYRLKTLMGLEGGPVGEAPGPAIRVRVAMCLLRIERRMKQVASGQAYTVSVDRLGVQEPQDVVGEDASLFFVL